MSHPRIITSPVRLTGSVHPQQISSLVAIDAMVRRRAALGEEPVNWELSTLAGDVAVQRAVERAVAREGDARDDLGREGFAPRALQLQTTADADLRALLSGLRIQANLDHWSAGSEEASRAARVAFVRLYEAGVLTRSDAVLDSCPSCQTVVDAADIDKVDLEVDQVRIALPLADGTLEIDTAEPELIVGAVAVAVPGHRMPPDAVVYLPLLDAEVPIVAVEGLAAPVFVVPGHDRWSQELARQLGYRVVEVLDGEGVVRHPGPLEGLGRHGARAAAIEQLTAEAYVIAHFHDVQPVKRCHRCGTVLVPLMGRHWILSFRELVDPLIDVIHAGGVAFAPAWAGDRLLAAAEQVGTWCVSQQLWTGHPIPVATCLDCGQTTVSVDEAESCGSCMGTLEPHTDVLDPRFIAAIVPLGMLGWPSDFQHDEVAKTTLSVGRSGIDAWALPMAALGLRLAGVVPFQQLIVHTLPIGVAEPGQRPTSELVSLVDQYGPRVIRAGLLTGDVDVERAQQLVDVLDSPADGTADLNGLTEPYDKALATLDAGGALAMVTQAVTEGVSPEAKPQLAGLAAPLLSE